MNLHIFSTKKYYKDFILFLVSEKESDLQIVGKSVRFKTGSARSTVARTDVRKWATRRVLFETLKEYTMGGACRIRY